MGYFKKGIYCEDEPNSTEPFIPAGEKKIQYLEDEVNELNKRIETLSSVIINLKNRNAELVDMYNTLYQENESKSIIGKTCNKIYKIFKPSWV